MNTLYALGLAVLVAAAGIQPFAAEYGTKLRSVASVDTVDVTPAQDTTFRNGYVVLTARVVDSIGRRKSTSVSWVSRNTAVVRLRDDHKDSAGFYSVTVRQGSDTGRTYVVATAGSKKDSSLVVARDTVCSTTVLASIGLVPDSVTMHRTDTAGFGMAPRNQCGGYMNGVNPTFSAGGSGLTVSRVDSLWGRAIATDSNGTAYFKAVSGTVRDSVKVKLKHAP